MQPVRLEDFGVSGVECGRICYLRDIQDADKLVAAMDECRGGRAVVIGGGYIGALQLPSTAPACVWETRLSARN